VIRKPRRRPARAWRIPSLYAAGALALGLIVPRLELHLWPGLASEMSVSAALAIYSSIASGMIALTGIVFSLTFVMVQFSATAYSPRLVMWLARDPLLSHALGTFTATFLYAIAALAWVDRSGSGSVPFVSAWMVVVLLLVSVAMFVGLIQRVSLLQINRMLAFTGDQGRSVIESLYPVEGPAAVTPEPAPPSADEPGQVVTYHGRPLAVQRVNVAELVALAASCGARVDVLAVVGDTVVESTPLMRVSGATRRIDERALRNAVELGPERTFEQDPKYAIRLLVDIAIRALSPAVNDPTTAVQALDQIGDLLLRLGRRHLEIGDFHDARGTLRVVMAFPTWDDFILLAFDEIRSYGATSVQVMRRMKALVRDLLAAVPEERRLALAHWQDRLQRTVAAHFTDPEEQRHALVEDRQGLGAPSRA